MSCDFISGRDKIFFLFSQPPRQALGSTHPLIQWVLGAVGLKKAGCEAAHSPPSSAEVKGMGLYLHFPVCLCSMNSDNFTL